MSKLDKQQLRIAVREFHFRATLLEIAVGILHPDKMKEIVTELRAVSGPYFDKLERLIDDGTIPESETDA